MRCHPERQCRGIKPPPNYLHLHLQPNHSNHNHDLESLEVASCLLMLANHAPNSPCHSQTGVAASIHANQLGGNPLPPKPQVHHYYYCSSYSLHHNQNLQQDADPNRRFECSGCKKVFGSHQALGGHRASHKNVKGCFAITKTLEADNGGCGGGGDQQCTNYNRHHVHVHKCSICLEIFSCGQALGRHMRCHWKKKVDEVGITAAAADNNDHFLIMEPLSSSSSSRPAFDLNFPAPQTMPIIQDKDSVEGDHSNIRVSGNLDLRLGD